MSDSQELEFTGERFTPECVREIAYEHWHRYAWASRLVAGRRVVDAACGEGYGSAMLSQRAASVIGVDIDPEAVAHGQRRYQADNLAFRCADCTDLPLADDSADVVVSFETLEHLAAQDELLAEFRRVLRPEGFLLISSPDRKTYSDATGYANPYHVRELYRSEFEDLLARHFPAWRLFGQKLMFVSSIWALAGSGSAEWLTADGTRLEESQRPAYPPLYFLAVAAASEALFPDIAQSSLFGDRQESVYAHYNEEVAKHIRAGQLLAERDTEIAELRARLERG
ncbi:MAG: class I SAM-dependent methyltransferase [Wenzhouxiangella sp.]|nr:class I SAM-dependent methyltransferase [Wenzhouxiangella sp.]